MKNRPLTYDMCFPASEHRERFESRLQDQGGHMVWDGPVSNAGSWPVWCVNQYQFSARRAMWLLMEKPLPDNMDLVATCDVAGCLTHLVAASSVDALRTHCPQGHALSGDNLVPCVKRERRCLRCHRKQSREAAARYRARKKSNRTVGA